MKKISIIIPLYNLEGLIGKCIASALDQDLPPEEYEVIWWTTDRPTVR